MTPSQYIKAQGLPNLAYVADKVGKHPDTINNWYHANFALFEVVVAGVKAKDAENRITAGVEEALKECGYEKNKAASYNHNQRYLIYKDKTK